MKLGIWESLVGRILLGRETVSSTHDAVELGALVALWPTGGILALTRAELAEVLSRPGHDVFEQLELDAPEGFAWILLVYMKPLD